MEKFYRETYREGEPVLNKEERSQNHEEENGVVVKLADMELPVQTDDIY